MNRYTVARLVAVGLLSLVAGALVLVPALDPTIYGILRFVLSIIGEVGVLFLLAESLRRHDSLRESTLTYILAIVMTLLAISALYELTHGLAPNPDPFLAAAGVAIRSSVAFGATILALASDGGTK